MRRQRDKKTLTLSETFINRDSVKAQLYPDRGFLFSNLVTIFKNNLETCRGGGGAMRWRTKNTGQSTLEYMIVLTTIIAAVMLAVPLIREKVQASFEHAATEMEEELAKLDY